MSTTDQASTAEEVSSLIGDAVERMAAVSEEMDDVSTHTEHQTELVNEISDVIERLESDSEAN